MKGTKEFAAWKKKISMTSFFLFLEPSHFCHWVFCMSLDDGMNFENVNSQRAPALSEHRGIGGKGA